MAYTDDDNTMCCGGSVVSQHINTMCCGGIVVSTVDTVCCSGVTHSTLSGYDCCGTGYEQDNSTLCCVARNGIEKVSLFISSIALIHQIILSGPILIFCSMNRDEYIVINYKISTNNVIVIMILMDCFRLLHKLRLTDYYREEDGKFITFLTLKKCRNWTVFG